MKSIRLNILLLLVASNVGLMAQTQPQAWVRETDITTGQMYDITLEPLGGAFTPTLAISEAGNRFELYAKGTAWDTKVYLLDTKLIRAYTPSASFTIDTGDPYVRGDVASGRFVKRMRADKTYTVALDVSGLVPGSASAAENSAYYVVHGTNYNPTTYSGLDQEEYEIFNRIMRNESISTPPMQHELTTPGDYACGEMKFTMVRWAADGVPDTIIAQPKIEIWPKATATITNIAENQVFIDRIPIVIFDYKDLYPDSRTYVQIYSGAYVPGKVGTIVGATERKFGLHYNPEMGTEPTTVPMTLPVGIEGLSTYTPKDGIYTVEVLTETPYDNREPESLKHVTFEVDFVISSRGKLSTAE